MKSPVLVSRPHQLIQREVLSSSSTSSAHTIPPRFGSSAAPASQGGLPVLVISDIPRRRAGAFRYALQCSNGKLGGSYAAAAPPATVVEWQRHSPEDESPHKGIPCRYTQSRCTECDKIFELVPINAPRPPASL